MLSGVGHALDILELLAEERRPLPLAHIAKKLSMSKPGVHRVLATLASRGFVERGEGGTYRLGMRVWEIGSAVQEKSIADIAGPVMQKLARKTGTSVFLVNLSGFSSVQLHQAIGDQVVQVHVVLGQHIPAHCSAGGLALLSCLSTEQLEAVTPSRLKPVTPLSIKDKQELHEELARTRKRGYSINLGGWREDVGGVGVPFKYEGDAYLALNVSAPIYRLTKKEIPVLAKATRLACEEIEGLFPR